MENSLYFQMNLDELDHQYHQLKDELMINKQTTHQCVREKLRKMNESYEAELDKMEEMIQKSSSRAVQEISLIQKEYHIRMNELIQHHLDWWMSGQDELELKMEEMMLCAEYAVDYMKQTMSAASLLVLKAIDLEMTYEEREKER